jgi:hypothetical protein
VLLPPPPADRAAPVFLRLRGPFLFWFGSDIDAAAAGVVDVGAASVLPCAVGGRAGLELAPLPAAAAPRRGARVAPFAFVPAGGAPALAAWTNATVAAAFAATPELERDASDPEKIAGKKHQIDRVK